MNTTRLDIRLKADTKELIQHAAELRNQSVTQFVVAALSEVAGKVLDEHQRTVLSERDRNLFLRLIDAPPRPTKALRKAAEDYKKRTML